MDFDIYKINDEAGLFAGVMVDHERQERGIPKYDASLADSNILRSPLGPQMVRGYVLGVIREYHEQLRQVLLEKQGIDIGPISPDDQDD